MIHLPPFSSAAFLDDLRAAGVRVRLDEQSRLLVTFGEVVSTPQLTDAIKRHREDLVRLLRHEQTLASAPASPEPLGSRFAGLSQQIEQRRRAEALIEMVRAGGGTISTDGQTVTVKGFRPDDVTVEKLKAAKPALLVLLAREQAEAEGASS